MLWHTEQSFHGCPVSYIWLLPHFALCLMFWISWLSLCHIYEPSHILPVFGLLILWITIGIYFFRSSFHALEPTANWFWNIVFLDYDFEIDIVYHLRTQYGSDTLLISAGKFSLPHLAQKEIHRHICRWQQVWGQSAGSASVQCPWSWGLKPLLKGLWICDHSAEAQTGDPPFIDTEA